MHPPELFQKLCAYVSDTAKLTSIRALIEWDEQTYMPGAGGEYRAEQVAYLSGLIHERRTDPRIGEWLAVLEKTGLQGGLYCDTGATIRELRRQYLKFQRMPKDLVEELSRASILGQNAWKDARKNSDFSAFAPHLEKMVRLKQQEAAALALGDCPYDSLLDDYEPGAKSQAIAAVLADLREQLVPLVAEIRSARRQPNRAVLKGNFPKAAQEAFGKEVAAAIGFSFERGRLDVSAHPFCTEVGPNDCRLTTRYDESCFSGAFFGILHETGHGLYEQGLRTDQYGLPLGSYVSLGIHESQSRLWENMVGRGRVFWEFFYPKLQAYFPAFNAVPMDDFYFAVNDVRPSLIRVEADEATYNLHILVRFELEQALIHGQLSVADLPGAWNEKYRAFLGVEPENDRVGVLQDIHWSAGLMGYFPTYTLGNLHAAQLYAQADSELGGLEKRFRVGEFEPLLDWLRSRVHAEGRRYNSAELIENVTHQPLSSRPFMDYLKGKLRPLYLG